MNGTAATKGRLAPSPTGAQHLGNARTYLLAYWSARKNNARLALRIEDVDSPRIKPWAIDQAIEDLAWLGITWEEGPDVGGPDAPYIQTERIELYQDALASLIQRNLAFPCTCTRSDIEAAGSAPHFEHEGKVYPGTCAAWSTGDPLPEDGTYCWRFRAGSAAVSFDDAVMGNQTCVPSRDLGDFPITQKNGNPSYQLAVVVDDAAMGIDEVVRGDDLLASTFRQIELFRALGKTVPSFAHVPLVRGTDGRRLAKRHGDTRLSHFRDLGIKAEQVVAWAAVTSGFADAGESVTADSIPDRFCWSKLSRESVIVENNAFRS